MGFTELSSTFGGSDTSKVTIAIHNHSVNIIARAHGNYIVQSASLHTSFPSCLNTIMYCNRSLILLYIFIYKTSQFGILTRKACITLQASWSIKSFRAHLARQTGASRSASEALPSRATRLSVQPKGTLLSLLAWLTTEALLTCSLALCRNQ